MYIALMRRFSILYQIKNLCTKRISGYYTECRFISCIVISPVKPLNKSNLSHFFGIKCCGMYLLSMLHGLERILTRVLTCTCIYMGSQGRLLQRPCTSRQNWHRFTITQLIYTVHWSSQREIVQITWICN